MKRFFVAAVCVLAFGAGIEAKELSVAGVLKDGEAYTGKAVSVKGEFLYSEPSRESFTIGQGSGTLEVFYRELPGNDKLFILSQPRNSRKPLLVSGMLRQYANKARFYFLDATSLAHEGAAAPVAGTSAVTFFDILSDPGKYVTKPVTMKGAFLYSEPLRQSFTFEQNGKTMEVIVSDLSKIDRERIMGMQKNSKMPVTVSGLLQTYANSKERFFITAYAVTLGN